jgi:hypothetical protein
MEQLNFDAINEDAPFLCKREGCSRRVAGYEELCYTCLSDVLTGKVIKEDGRYMLDPEWKPKRRRRAASS